MRSEGEAGSALALRRGLEKYKLLFLPTWRGLICRLECAISWQALYSLFPVKNIIHDKLDNLDYLLRGNKDLWLQLVRCLHFSCHLKSLPRFSCIWVGGGRLIRDYILCGMRGWARAGAWDCALVGSRDRDTDWGWGVCVWRAFWALKLFKINDFFDKVRPNHVIIFPFFWYRAK